MAEDFRLADDGGMKLTCLLLCVLLASCTQERPSEIVQRVQDAGAGNVRSVSQESLEQWFRQHREIANEIKGRCAPIQQGAPATWGDTTEGRVCKAASVATASSSLRERGMDAASKPASESPALWQLCCVVSFLATFLAHG